VLIAADSDAGDQENEGHEMVSVYLDGAPCPSCFLISSGMPQVDKENIEEEPSDAKQASSSANPESKAITVRISIKS